MQGNSCLRSGIIDSILSSPIQSFHRVLVRMLASEFSLQNKGHQKSTPAGSIQCGNDQFVTPTS